MDMSKEYTNVSLITVLLVAGTMAAQSHIASEMLHQNIFWAWYMRPFFYLKIFLRTGFTFMYVLQLVVNIL